jgi:hypothetical protein
MGNTYHVPWAELHPQRNPLDFPVVVLPPGGVVIPVIQLGARTVGDEGVRHFTRGGCEGGLKDC